MPGELHEPMQVVRRRSLIGVIEHEDRFDSIGAKHGEGLMDGVSALVQTVRRLPQLLLQAGVEGPQIDARLSRPAPPAWTSS